MVAFLIRYEGIDAGFFAELVNSFIKEVVPVCAGVHAGQYKMNKD